MLSSDLYSVFDVNLIFRSEVIALMKEISGYSLPLFKFIEMFEKRSVVDVAFNVLFFCVLIFTAHQRSCGRIMFSVVSVCLYKGRGFHVTTANLFKLVQLPPPLLPSPNLFKLVHLGPSTPSVPPLFPLPLPRPVQSYSLGKAGG